MCNDNNVRAAKRFVFGEPPANSISMVGYDIATRYYGPLIDKIEPVLNNRENADASLAICLEKAFVFPSYYGFDRFPRETREVISQCGEKFQERYETLLENDIKAPLPSSDTDRHPQRMMHKA